jgi:cytochrome bd-type quinol oxidase subunit 2
MRTRSLAMAMLVAFLLFAAVAGPALAQEAGGNRNNNDENACRGRHRRACEIPEVPVAAAIPVVGLLGVAGYVLIDRRRRRGSGAQTS